MGTHAKYFICYIRILYYIYYMNRIAASHDPLDDGWNDPSASPALRDKREVSLSCGDTVLYTAEGQPTPAKLVAPAGGGCWLARSARFLHELIYLDPDSIVLRLPRNDLRDEAA